MRSELAIWSQPRARLTGVVYLLYFSTAIGGSILSDRLVAVAGIVSGVSLASYVAVTVLFYALFRPVDATVSLVAALLGLAGCGTTALATFRHATGVSALAFFGPFCILLGYLIIRSGFLPWALGALLVAAGIGWLTYLSSFGRHVLTAIEVVGIFGEASLMLWLIVFGVNVRRWKELAGLDTSTTAYR